MNLNVEKNLRNFFDKYFWGQHPEAALRYAPVVSEIKKAKLQNSKILEIGSGSLGITPYFKKRIDGVDIDFAGPKSDYLNKIKGSGSKLPFRKNTYDVSISVDVLEHILPTDREKAIFEMMRVTKKLAIIVVPCGKGAEEQDRQLNMYWQKLMKSKNKFLTEHVENGLPKADETLVYIDRAKRLLNKNATVTSYPNLNLFVRNVLMKTWITNNKYIYYLYLKGYLFAVPILKFFNFSKAYRRVFVIKFAY
ncbi:MAG: methyltransferase domain-containing protein [Patescibacteria group bacterium]